MRKLSSLKQGTAVLLSAVLALSPVSAAGPWVLMASADVGTAVATSSDYSYGNDDDGADGDGTEVTVTEGEDADGSGSGAVSTDDGDGTASGEGTDDSTEDGDNETGSYSISDSDVTESGSSEDTEVDAVSGADGSSGSLSVALTGGELTLETGTITSEASMAALTVDDDGNYGSGTDGNISWVVSADGVLTISGDGDMEDYYLYNYPWSTYRYLITEAVVEEGVTSIGDYAFYYCYEMETVTLPAGLESIGDHAFYYCSTLTSIDIPEGVTSIGTYAFAYCSGLETVTVSEGLESIGESAFRRCESLVTLELPGSLISIGNYAFRNCSSLIFIDIPEGVTSIGNYAFAGCSGLETVLLPSSLESIGYGVFGDTVLAYVHYRGTEEQWSEISISSYNDELSSASFHYECDGGDIESGSTEIEDEVSSSGSAELDALVAQLPDESELYYVLDFDEEQLEELEETYNKIEEFLSADSTLALTEDQEYLVNYAYYAIRLVTRHNGYAAAELLNELSGTDCAEAVSYPYTYYDEIATWDDELGYYEYVETTYEFESYRRLVLRDSVEVTEQEDAEAIANGCCLLEIEDGGDLTISGDAAEVLVSLEYYDDDYEEYAEAYIDRINIHDGGSLTVEDFSGNYGTWGEDTPLCCAIYVYEGGTLTLSDADIRDIECDGYEGSITIYGGGTLNCLWIEEADFDELWEQYEEGLINEEELYDNMYTYEDITYIGTDEDAYIQIEEGSGYICFEYDSGITVMEIEADIIISSGKKLELDYITYFEGSITVEDGAKLYLSDGLGYRSSGDIDGSISVEDGGLLSLTGDIDNECLEISVGGVLEICRNAEFSNYNDDTSIEVTDGGEVYLCTELDDACILSLSGGTIYAPEEYDTLVSAFGDGTYIDGGLEYEPMDGKTTVMYYMWMSEAEDTGDGNTVTYTITFDPNGGSLADEDESDMTTGEDGTLGSFPEDPVRDGYTFAGWYTAAEDGEEVTEDTVFTADTTIYAQWTENEEEPEEGSVTYTITFDANGGSLADEDESDMTTGEDGTLGSFPEDPVRDGYTFTGWYTAAEDGEEVTEDTVFTADTTVYAQWTEAESSDEDQGGDETGDDESGGDEDGSQDTGDDDEDGSNDTEDDNDGTTDNETESPSTEDSENNGDNESVATPEDYTGSDDQVSQENEETELSSGEDTEGTEDDDTQSPDEDEDGSVEEEEGYVIYTITFDPNGGTVTTAELETGEDGKVSTLPTPYRSGYSFNGWYTAASGGAKITAGNVFTADITLYAQWTSKNSSSSSNGGGGNSTSNATIYADGTTSGYVVTGSDGTTTTGTGSWVQTDMGWRFNFDNSLGAAVDRWVVLTWNGVSSWYRFDANGYMVTGWYTDPSTGYTYFLYDISDGKQGYMYTGWKQIEGKWYYFSETEGEEFGRLIEESDTAPEG